MRLDRLDMFHALEGFPVNTQLVEEHGPSSPAGQHWLSNATVLLQQLDSQHTSSFQQMANKLASGLGGGAPGPLWNMARYVLRQAVVDLSLRVAQPPQGRPENILDRLELIADSERSRTLIPTEGEHRFRTKANTHSDGSRTLIPSEAEHP